MSKHYISIDEAGRVVKGFSDEFENPSPTDILIDEDGCRHFMLNGILNPALTNDYLIPLYKYVDGVVVNRTEAEINADMSQLQRPKTEIEILRETLDSLILSML